MKPDRFIAFKFMLKGTERGTFSAMTLFAWLAIGIGIGAMSCLLSVMYGFETALMDRVLNVYPHIMIKPVQNNRVLPFHGNLTQRFEQIDGVVRVVPYIESEMIIQSDQRTLGGVIWGVPPKELERLEKDLDGNLPDPTSLVPQGILGSELAMRLGVSEGDQIKLISPIESSGPLGMVPRAQTFEVSGVFSSGHYDFDQQYLFLLLPDAQDLLRMQQQIAGWQIWVEDMQNPQPIQSVLQPMLPEGWQAQSWTEYNAALFQSLKLEQYAMFTILSFAIAIAVLGVVITLIMYVTQKRRNIGILRCLGATKRQIRNIFIWQGAFLGAVGLALGGLLTVAFIIYVKFFSTFQLPDIYYDRSLPLEIRPLSLVAIYLIAIVMIYLATLYPAKKASEYSPIEAIRQ